MDEHNHSLTAPVGERSRLHALDTLRGVALFGILLLNIIAFANPFAAYLDPRVDGATVGLDLAVFVTVDTLFEGSLRAIFSMLFGAGMLLFLNKPGAGIEVIRGLYYRRTLLLVAFGLFNAYVLIWPGDILYTYGMAGLLLYFFRAMPARRLLYVSLAVFALLTLLHSGAHVQARLLGNAVAGIETLPPGSVLSDAQQQSLADWDDFLEQQFLQPEQIAEELATKKSGYAANFIAAARINVLVQTVGMLFNGLWDVMAMMLLGMALLKWGILDGSVPAAHYWRLIVLGFGIGLPVNAFETLTFVSSGFDLHWAIFNRPTYDLGRISMALGYIGAIMLICKSGLLQSFQRGMGRVGQMALSNYLLQTLICNWVFLGFGLGLAGELSRLQIYAVVLAVWALQLTLSVLWLRYYRFGPAEWLWRSLTYGSRQPLRLSQSS